jgi:NADPH-dependent 2,4-dienoyl-CoA reductase/sulfur reductase-like enzyme
MRHADVLVIGAGPGGIAAATAAANAGANVTVLDDNAALGGQIWRGGVVPEKRSRTSPRDRALRAFAASGAELLAGRTVFAAPRPRTLQAFVEESMTIENFTWDRLILATGTRERFLPFPGWTLPGVFGAGGLQALVKGGYAIAGKRVVVAGTGPLLLAVATHLQQAGAEIVAMTEQARFGSLVRLGASLLAHPRKLMQGAGYRVALSSVPYRTGCWPVAAEGSDRLMGVRLTDGDETWTEACDLLACGFHLVPNTELATLLGCQLNGDVVAVDRLQKTSQKAIFCVGEPTGIAGVDAALVQGRIAGLAVTGREDEAAAFFAQRDRERAVGHKLDRAFQLRSELRNLAQPDTIVCRCEDVRYAQLEPHSDWTSAKLMTRCGMGPCQGRVCGPAVQTLFGWHNASIRPPLYPIPLSALLSGASYETIVQTELQETA